MEVRGNDSKIRVINKKDEIKPTNKGWWIKHKIQHKHKIKLKIKVKIKWNKYGWIT